MQGKKSRHRPYKTVFSVEKVGDCEASNYLERHLIRDVLARVPALLSYLILFFAVAAVSAIPISKYGN